MTPGTALATYLATVTAVTDITTNIQPVVMTQRVTAAVLYSFSHQYVPVLETTTEIEESSSMEITCVAVDYDRAHILADAVDAALLGFTGLMGGASGVNFGHVVKLAKSDRDIELSADKIYFGVGLTYSVCIVH